MKLFGFNNLKNEIQKIEDIFNQPRAVATINEDVMETILNDNSDAMKEIRKMCAYLYNANNYQRFNLFNLIAICDYEQMELVYNILDSFKNHQTRFILEQEVTPQILQKYDFYEMKIK